jgi:hypothetical protein
MKLSARLSASIAIVVVRCLGVEAQESCWAERGLRSPDGRFIVRCFDEHVEIANAVTGETSGRIGVLPSYIVSWIQDSRTVAVLEHLAGGSDAVLIHFDGQRWRVIRTWPLEESDYDHIAVVELTPEHNSFRISYRADLREDSRVLYFLIKFDIDLQTGEQRNKSVRPISYETYVGLHPLGPG